MEQTRQWKSYPKKPIRSFRDLEVYTKTLECAVVIASSVRTSVPDFPELSGMVNCALSIPLWIAEAHSIRFANKKEGITLLERAMAGCNKMVVYIEEMVGVYGVSSGILPEEKTEKTEKKKTNSIPIPRNTLSLELADDLVKKYIEVRGKIFRLEQSWKKWDTEDAMRKV
ncbi:MAG: hypothetical protein LiPW41_380 [Parcubacteria group bacterium LiPW_41]|nr:MAG: hypothetical protein LiPW41_380 [Parcubacteria group bacterium LiPW_41]